MILAQLIIVLAFIWLGYETKWLTARLPIGITEPIYQYEYKGWEELRPWNPNFKLYPMWVTCPDNMSPLTGWDWVKNTMHVIPEYRIQLFINEHYRQDIHLKNPSAQILKEVMKINTGKKYFAQQLATA